MVDTIENSGEGDDYISDRVVQEMGGVGCCKHERQGLLEENSI